MSNFSITNSTERRDLTGVIAQSARRAGVDYNYLIAQAQLESGMRPDAKAKSSSATGLYQFIEQTWLGLVKEKGDEYGLGWAKDAISQNSRGHFTIADKSLKSDILALRKDPQIAANFAGEFASDNSQYLEQRTGRKPEAVDLYLAHFLGPAGAAKFVSKLDSNPDGAAATSFPRAARSNRNIFYTKAGSARSFQDVRDRFDSKLSKAVQLVGGGKTVPPAGNNLPSAAQGQNYVQPLDYLRVAKGQLNDRSRLDQPNPFSHPAQAAYLMLASLGM